MGWYTNLMCEAQSAQCSNHLPGPVELAALQTVLCTPGIAVMICMPTFAKDEDSHQETVSRVVSLTWKLLSYHV